MSNFITIKEASKRLGVTPLTLRNWDKSGKLKALRHPMSNYRVYRSEDIDNLIKEIDSGNVTVKAKPKKPKARKLIVRHL